MIRDTDTSSVRSLTSRNEPAAIEAEGLVYRFGDKVAVAGVNLNVALGEIFGVLGPNGAGKTSTIRMLATLLTPHAGTAHIFGHDVVHEADAVRGKVSLTGQSPRWTN